MLAKREEIIRRNARNPGVDPQGNLSRQQARGGGMEYAIVLAVSIIASVAYTIISQMLIIKLFTEIELLVEWLEAGGFRRLVKQT